MRGEECKEVLEIIGLWVALWELRGLCVTPGLSLPVVNPPKGILVLDRMGGRQVRCWGNCLAHSQAWERKEEARESTVWWRSYEKVRRPGTRRRGSQEAGWV